MKNKLKCVLVDEDTSLHETVKNLCSSSNLAVVTQSFICPKQFLEAAPNIDFDICLLDLYMSEMNGIMLAKRLNGKLVIFVTGVGENLKDAIEADPLDILFKPLKKDRFIRAIEKATALLNESKSILHDRGPQEQKYKLFNVAESKEKVRLCLSDIYFVGNDSDDSRNKSIVMKDGKQFTLMRYTFEELLGFCSTLTQVNRSELISIEAVQKVRHDLISLKFNDPREIIVKQVTLNRTYRQSFMSRMKI
ncbi:MAG: LytR/AlgR family response regulator transcription factor [Bacteroidia bacterium]